MKGKVKQRIATGAGIALGFIFLIAGIGKLIEWGDFADVVVVKTFLPDTLAALVSYSVPPAEVIIGGLLLAGFMPKPAAILSLLLSFSFIINNLWLMSMNLPTCPHCFGWFERIISKVVTWQPIYTDIVLVVLAAGVIIFHTGSFFVSHFWFVKTEAPASS